MIFIIADMAGYDRNYVTFTWFIVDIIFTSRVNNCEKKNLGRMFIFKEIQRELTLWVGVTFEDYLE